VALAEMAFAGNLGMQINLIGVPLAGEISRTDQILFSESTTRFIIEIAPENFDRVAKLCKNIRFGQLGTTTGEPLLTIKDMKNQTLLETPIDQCKQVWQQPLNW